MVRAIKLTGLGGCFYHLFCPYQTWAC